MRVTHVITRLIVGGAQENTIATVLGLHGKPGVLVKLISGPTTGPEGSLESRFAESPELLSLSPELVRPIHPWNDLVALRQLAGIFRRDSPDIVHTHSGKAGILGLTKTLAKEWGRYNVNVNAVGFGLIETRLIQPLMGQDATIDIKGNRIGVGVQPHVLDNIRVICPLGRLGSTDEAANAVLFFCSPLSDYVTGEVLICGGGLHF